MSKNNKYIPTEITIYFAWFSFFMLAMSANIVYTIKSENSWIVRGSSIFFFINVILGIIGGCYISKDLNTYNGSIPKGIKVAVKLNMIALCLIMLTYLTKTDLTIWR